MKHFLQLSQTVSTAVDEFDYNERIKISAVLQYFQDLATAHAIDLGIGFETMKAQNLCWVLSRLSATIEKQPKIGDKITVITYPRKPNLVDAVRDYFVYDQEGVLLMRGTSKWCVLDFCNRAIRRCKSLFSFADSQYKPDELYENGNPQLISLESVDAPFAGVFDRSVQITDLDRNRHMNNARYGDVILNTFDMAFLDKHQLQSFDINFLTELLPGQKFSLTKKQSDHITFVEAVKPGKMNINEIVFRARIVWLPL